MRRDSNLLERNLLGLDTGPLKLNSLYGFYCIVTLDQCKAGHTSLVPKLWPEGHVRPFDVPSAVIKALTVSSENIDLKSGL